MTDSQNFGFAKLVPGFDFLQNLAKGTADAMPQMPSLSNWVAPTLNVEEIDKRIQELRAVHFWLEQNAKALSATIQALEVQKMTLSTLQGMNCSMADLAKAMQAQAVVTPAAAAANARSSAPQPGAGSAAKPSRKAAAPSPAKPAEAPAGVVDPMQWWGSLTQQFQNIASTALQDAAQKTADTARDMADNAQAAAASVAPAKKAARKTAPRQPAPARKAVRRAGG